VTFHQAPPILETLLAQANALGAPVTVIDRSGLDEFPATRGDHQRWNTASRSPPPALPAIPFPEIIERAWPARAGPDDVSSSSGRPLPPVLVDGAHNPSARMPGAGGDRAGGPGA